MISKYLLDYVHAKVTDVAGPGRMPMGITNPLLIPQISSVLNKSKLGYHQRSSSILAFDAPGTGSC